MKNNSLKFLLPLLITSFIGLVTFIYLSGRAESKESVSDAKETAVLANEKADEAINKITKVEGDVNTLSTKLNIEINNIKESVSRIEKNTDYMRDAMVDNGIKPR